MVLGDESEGKDKAFGEKRMERNKTMMNVDVIYRFMAERFTV